MHMLLAEALAKDPDLKGEAFTLIRAAGLGDRTCADDLAAGMNSTLQPVILNQASNEIRRQFLGAKAHERLQWTPLYSLESGLGETIDWYRRLLGETR